MPVFPSVRRLSRVAAGAVLASGLGAAPLHAAADPLGAFPLNAPIASQSGFGTAWDSFFDTTREVGLFNLYGCLSVGTYADPSVRTQDCIGVRAERGYELATGLGALRLVVAERQAGAGVVGGPANIPGAPTVNALAADGSPGGIYFFDVAGETVIRSSAFLGSDGLATLLALPGGTVGHFHYFFDVTSGGTSLSQSTYRIEQVESVVVPGTLASTVPEPGTWALLGTGLLAVAGVARRKRAAR